MTTSESYGVVRTTEPKDIAIAIIKQNTATRKLGAILGVFVMCWSPYLVVTLYIQVSWNI